VQVCFQADLMAYSYSNRKVCLPAVRKDVLDFRKMVWMQEFPQMVYWLHFRKDGLKPNRKALMQMDLTGEMNCFLQMVLTTGLTVSLPTAQTGGMTNRMKRPVAYDLKYCSKTSVPK
jgi:hypothetical protein